MTLPQVFVGRLVLICAGQWTHEKFWLQRRSTQLVYLRILEKIYLDILAVRTFQSGSVMLNVWTTSWSSTFHFNSDEGIYHDVVSWTCRKKITWKEADSLLKTGMSSASPGTINQRTIGAGVPGKNQHRLMWSCIARSPLYGATIDPWSTSHDLRLMSDRDWTTFLLLFFWKQPTWLWRALPTLEELQTAWQVKRDSPCTRTPSTMVLQRLGNIIHVYSRGQPKPTNRLSGREFNVSTRLFQNWALNFKRRRKRHLRSFSHEWLKSSKFLGPKRAHMCTRSHFPTPKSTIIN